MSDKYNLSARDWALLALVAERAKLPKHERTEMPVSVINQVKRLEIEALIDMSDSGWYVPTTAGWLALADHAATSASILREQRVRDALEQALSMLDDYSSPAITVEHETTQKFVKETRAMLDDEQKDDDQSEMPTRPDLDGIETALETFDANWFRSWGEAHQFMQESMWTMALGMPGLLAYVKALEGSNDRWRTCAIAARDQVLYMLRLMKAEGYDTSPEDEKMKALEAALISQNGSEK